jgi:hypothetical protein
MAPFRWTSLFLVIQLVLPPAAAAQQPPPAPRDRAAFGSIRGEVFDSLLSEALAGASVRVRGTELRATTDGRGRFRLDAVPAGLRVLVVEHPVLDSVGLSGLTKSVDVVSGAATKVSISTPSLRTIAAAACGGRPAAAGRDSALLFGAVRDAERGMRLAHAQVVVSWLDIRRGPGPLRVTRRIREVLTDSLGNYYACGVARGVALVVQAAAESFVSGELDLEVGERRLLRHDLAVSRETWGVPGDSAAGAARGGASLVGTVRSESGPPLEGALASVAGAASDAMTDATGRFTLAGLPSGSRMLYVRRVGYRFTAVPVDLRNRDTTVVSLELPMFSMLDTLRVTASRWVRTEIDELDRRMGLASTGRVMREEELRAVGSISTLFYSFPSLDVRTRPGGFDLQMRDGARSCAPTIWIDGWRSDAEVLQAYRPSDLVALEVYPAMEVPMRYLGAFRSCGVVLAWTRYLQ